MATRTLPERKTARPTAPAGLSPEILVAAYRNMLLSRRIDDKEVQLKRQNKIFFTAEEVELVHKRLSSTHWKRKLPTVAMVSHSAIGETYLRPVDY